VTDPNFEPINFHVVGLDLRWPSAERCVAVKIDDKPIAGVSRVNVDAAADGVPTVTLTFVAARVTGTVEGTLGDDHEA
jgi:hypothetical protein